MIWGVLAVCVGVLALYLHHIFEGECLILDRLREGRLARLNLSVLDQQSFGQSDKSDIVISLTTTPSRIALIEPTLKSLLDQKLPPAKIVLNVPDFSKRENVAYQLPDFLDGLEQVQVRRCEDLGPATKLIPTLLDEPADTPILIVDDDRIYPPWLVAHYARAARRYPDRALTLAGWVVPKDLVDRNTTIWTNLMMRAPTPIRAPRLRHPRQIDVLLGVFSYLVRPRYFDLDEMTDFDTGPKELFFVDDVRTSALCQVEKWVIPAPSLSFIPSSVKEALQNTRLGQINAGPGAPEDRNNSIGIRHYRDRWKVGGPE